MSGPAVLDAPSIVLADVDPALRLLPQALPPGWTAQPWELHDLVWTPGEGCRLVVRLRPLDAPARFVAVDVWADGWTWRDYQEDPGLPGLARAADPGEVARLLADRLDGPVRRCRVEAVRYRSGSRCVLRYDLRTATTWTSVYAKVLTPERFPGAARIQQGLTGTGEHGPLLVPLLVSVWADLQTLVGEAIHGRTVSSVLAAPAEPVTRRLRLAHELGGVLADFHGRDVAAQQSSSHDQIASLIALLPAVRLCDPVMADRIAGLLDQLASRAPSTSTEVLGHGAFRAGQVVLSPHRGLVLLDTDGARRCDQGRDLGNALAHLRWEAIRRPAQQPVLRQAEQALLAGYVDRTPVTDRETLAWWRAAGLLQVALRRYRRLEVSQWKLLPEVVGAAADLLASPPSAPPAARPAPTDLRDVRQMTRMLGPALAPHKGGAHHVRVESAVELAVEHGGRSVVGYTVRGLDGPRATYLVGKRFEEQRRARLLHDHLHLLGAGPFAAGRLRVPALVAFLPALGMVVYRRCEGTPLHRIPSPDDRARDARLAARWLARLHTCGVRLPRTFCLDQEEQSTRKWATVVAARHPGLAGRAHALATAWAAGARAAQPVPAVPIHKDFHPGHVLVGADVCVIDLDEARNGDPTFDVAHFLSYLELMSPDSTRTAAAFLEEYADTTGWADVGSYRSFCAYTWLKIAKQCALGTGPCRAVPADRRPQEAARALARGERCLSE
jgi:aminoglycoside phosphotransferase (APT) family kinase protein